jgi:hypothetical protein
LVEYILVVRRNWILFIVFQNNKNNTLVAT